MKKKSERISEELIFACHSTTSLCECHGMEIAIGTLTAENLEEMAVMIEEGMYLESDYFNGWYQYDNVYHENGVFLDGSDVDDLNDKNEWSTSNFEIGDVEFIDLTLDKKKTYLCTFRNETIYQVSKGMVTGRGKKKVDCEVSTFGFLETIADVSVAILKSSSVNGVPLERDSADEEDSGEIYDTNQFLIKNGQIVFFASNGSGQYPFYLDESVFQLSPDLEQKSIKKIIKTLTGNVRNKN